MGVQATLTLCNGFWKNSVGNDPTRKSTSITSRTIVLMFWSPRVPVGVITEALAQEAGLELVVNAEYARRIDELRRLAMATTRDTGNPFFRSLQILEHLRA